MTSSSHPPSRDQKRPRAPPLHTTTPEPGSCSSPASIPFSGPLLTLLPARRHHGPTTSWHLEWYVDRAAHGLGALKTDPDALVTYYQTHDVPLKPNPGLLVLSIVVSILGSYATLLLLGRRTSSRGWRNHSLLIVAAICFSAVAVWGMHFVSMISVRLQASPDVTWYLEVSTAGQCTARLLTAVLARHDRHVPVRAAHCDHLRLLVHRLRNGDSALAYRLVRRLRRSHQCVMPCHIQSIAHVQSDSCTIRRPSSSPT